MTNKLVYLYYNYSRNKGNTKARHFDDINDINNTTAVLFYKNIFKKEKRRVENIFAHICSS